MAQTKKEEIEANQRHDNKLREVAKARRAAGGPKILFKYDKETEPEEKKKKKGMFGGLGKKVGLW